jgi:hypothetical protein
MFFVIKLINPTILNEFKDNFLEIYIYVQFLAIK